MAFRPCLGVLLGRLASVLGIGLLASGCASDGSGIASAPSNQGLGGYYSLGVGGSVSSDNDGSSELTGGKTICTAELLDQIKDAACSGWSSELEVVPSLLEFVVDTSGSMLELAPQSKLSKWSVTRDALAAAIDDFLPDDTAVGVLFYPNQATIPNSLADESNSQPLPTSECVNVSAMVGVAPIGAQGSAQRAALALGLASAQPAGGTPTDDAYEYALTYGLMPAIKSYASYIPYAVLVTDGQPTILQGCKGTGDTLHPVDWHPIVQHIGEVAAAPNMIKTFIIGTPGSNAQSATGDDGRPWLSLAARTGLTPRSQSCSDEGPNYCHFDLSQSTDLATDLSAGLKEIIRAIPCSFNMPAAPANCVLDASKLNVIYEQDYSNGQSKQTWLIGQSEPSCGSEGDLDGWYIDSNANKVVLCPTTCQTVQSDQRARLEILSGCNSIAPPVN
jgi:hypothetical protein